MAKSGPFGCKFHRAGLKLALVPAVAKGGRCGRGKVQQKKAKAVFLAKKSSIIYFSSESNDPDISTLARGFTVCDIIV